MLLYIDPGTGSMLFSILIGIVSTLVFFGRQLFLKIKFIILFQRRIYWKTKI